MSSLQKRYPHIGQLSVTILEHYVRTVIGEEAVKEIKSPLVEKQLRDALEASLVSAEERFIRQYTNRTIAEVVMALPLADLPSMTQAVAAFHQRPSDDTLANTIRKQLSDAHPRIAQIEIDAAVSAYISILRKELAAAIPTIRESLRTLSNLEIEENTAQIAAKLDTLIQLLTPKFAVSRLLGNIPPRPAMVIGREAALKELKKRIGITTEDGISEENESLTIVRGWPGVGKTTLVNTLAHEPEIALAFPDGVLWTALGENPNVFSELAGWGRALGVDDIGRLPTLEEARARLAAILRNKQMLLIVDDVWQTEQGLPFKLGGEKCVTLFTTRFQDVARALADMPERQVYSLPVLTDDKGLELLKTLSPQTVLTHPEDSLTLVKELEGLPLAIQVAGRLLSAEQARGWGVTDLILELKEGAKLLSATAPADRADIVQQTTPTVAALLKKSTDTLDEETQIYFAFLGAFAPKPATFDLPAMAAVWAVEDPKPTAGILMDRGLLEAVGTRYQMHALLVAHAKSLLEDDEEP